MNISAVIITKNEQENISGCIESLKFCDEVIVVDDYSDDKTGEISKSLGAKVFKRKLNGNFSSQRNFALGKCSKDWALFIDADEKVTSSLRDEISKHNLEFTNYSGFYLKREDVLWGRQMKHGEFGKKKLLRLAKVGAGKWKRRVHEVWEVKGRVGTLKNSLIHYPHQTLREFVSDVNWQSTLHAKANFEEGKRSNLIKIILYPKLKFIKNWVIDRGFLDGTQGFVAALIMSFHSFLAWGKLWKMQKEK